VWGRDCTAFAAKVVDAYTEPFEKTWKLDKVELLLHLGGRLFCVPEGDCEG